MASVRTYAKQLGLDLQSCGSHSIARLNFPKGSPIHKLWTKVLQMQKPHNTKVLTHPVPNITFEAIAAVVDEYGEQVWGTTDRSALVSPGEYPEYPQALFWEDDRDQILDVFRALYIRRKEGPSKPATPHKKRMSTFSSSKVIDLDDSSDSDDSDDSLLGIGEPKSTLSRRITLPPDELDMFLTTLWIAAPQINSFAELKLGILDTTPLLFSAIQTVLNQGRSPAKQITPEAMLKVIIAPPLNLSPELEHPIVIEPSFEGDKVLRKLRDNLAKDWAKYRENSSMEDVICYASVYLQEGMFAE